MLVEYTKRLAQALHVVGLINIQFIVMDEQVYVIEVNPRSSRTVPYISKVTGIPIVDLATKVIIGNTIKGMGYTGTCTNRRLYRNQDAGILLRETAWSRDQPWTGNEINRRVFRNCKEL